MSCLLEHLLEYLLEHLLEHLLNLSWTPYIQYLQQHLYLRIFPLAGIDRGNHAGTHIHVCLWAVPVKTTLEPPRVRAMPQPPLRLLKTPICPQPPPSSPSTPCSLCPSEFPGDFISPIPNWIRTQFAVPRVTSCFQTPHLIYRHYKKLQNEQNFIRQKCFPASG